MESEEQDSTELSSDENGQVDNIASLNCDQLIESTVEDELSDDSKKPHPNGQTTQENTDVVEINEKEKTSQCDEQETKIIDHEEQKDANDVNEVCNSLLSQLNMEVEEASKEDDKTKLEQNGIEPPKVRKRVRIKLPATEDEDSDEDRIEVDTIVESGEVCYLFEESKFDSEPDLTKVPAPKKVRVVRIKERKPVKTPIIFYPRPPDEVSGKDEEKQEQDSEEEKKEDEEAERAKIEKLKKRLEKRRGRRRMFRDRKRYWIRMICKAVQIFMIGVSVVSVPVDLYKLVDGVIKSANALDGPTALEYLDFYSAAIGTHIIGGAGAIESEAVLTVLSRLASTWLYQVDQASKNSSEGPPSDPKQIQKWIKEKVPRHRLPKGYKFPKEDETVQSSADDDYMGMGGYPGMGGMAGMGGMGMDGMYPGMDGLDRKRTKGKGMKTDKKTKKGGKNSNEKSNSKSVKGKKGEAKKKSPVKPKPKSNKSKQP